MWKLHSSYNRLDPWFSSIGQEEQSLYLFPLSLSIPFPSLSLPLSPLSLYLFPLSIPFPSLSLSPLSLSLSPLSLSLSPLYLWFVVAGGGFLSYWSKHFQLISQLIMKEKYPSLSDNCLLGIWQSFDGEMNTIYIRPACLTRCNSTLSDCFTLPLFLYDQQ